jgi:hypothetical protein
MSQDLATHLQDLISPSNQEASGSAAWSELLDKWEREAGSISDHLEEEEGQRPYEPLPTLLDFYKPGPQALAFPRLDDEVHDRHMDESYGYNGEPRALPVVQAPPAASASGVEQALAQKIRRYVMLAYLCSDVGSLTKWSPS